MFQQKITLFDSFKNPHFEVLPQRITLIEDIFSWDLMSMETFQHVYSE